MKLDHKALHRFWEVHAMEFPLTFSEFYQEAVEWSRESTSESRWDINTLRQVARQAQDKKYGRRENDS